MQVYRNYLLKVNHAFESLINEIDVIYNFDHGGEFEILLYKVLRKILPIKYGIVRGHVITKEGHAAGDDIIIYDCVRFPSLRLLENDNFGQKQFIPIEAVYAYIEAKNTLYPWDVNGDIPNFHKACEQVSKVKALPRERIPASCEREYWPKFQNPIFGVVWSRQLAYSASQKCKFTDRHKKKKDNCCLCTKCNCQPDEFGTNSSCCFEQLHETLEDQCSIVSRDRPDQFAPDLIVAGSDYVAFPCIGRGVYSPFYIPKHSLLMSFHSDKKAFGIGITNLLWALDNITLGSIDWGYVLSKEMQYVNLPPSRK